MRLAAGTILGFALLSAVAPGQTAAPGGGRDATDRPGLVLRFDVDLVQMDAVVTDSSGRHVSNLRSEDFAVTQDGVMREIRHLSYSDAGSQGLAPEALRDASVLLLRKDQVQRTVVLLVDDEHMAFEDFAFARGSIAQFVDRGLRPGDLISILRVSGGSGAMQQFSSDPTFLRTAAKSMSWSPPPSPPLRRSVIDSLMRAIRALGDLPGRKSIIWIGPGIDPRNSSGASWEEIRRIADLANRASVTVDTIHSTPLPEAVAPAIEAAPPPDPRSLRGAPKVGSSSAQKDGVYYRAEREMIEISEMSAGMFQPYTNDLAGEITKAANDSDGYYVLGWYPGEGAFGSSAARRIDYHNVRIRVKRKGLKVRTRMGFYAAVGTASERSHFDSEAKAQEALFSPFQSGEIGVRLLASFEPFSSGGGSVMSLLHIAPNGIEFHPDATLPGCVTVSLEYLVSPVLLDWRNSDPPEVQWREYSARFCGEGRVHALQDGLAATVVVPVAHPGAYQIRVAVRNLPIDWQPRPPSQDAKVLTNRVSPVHIAVGSASQSLEIPDLSRTELAVAGLTLRGAAASPNQAGEVLVRVARAGDPAVRRFHAGDSLHYEFRLIQRGAESETRVEVLHEGKTIYIYQRPRSRQA